MRSLVWLLLVLWLSFTLVVADETPEPQVRVVAEGLLNPVGLAWLPGSGLLIAEEGTGDDDDSAGVSLMTPEGTIGRLVSGFPSGRDSGDLSGVALVAVSPDERRVYMGGFNMGQLHVLPVAPGQALTLPEVPWRPEELAPAMRRLNNVRLINPFDMTFDADGVPVVADASGNGVAKENPDGTVRFFHRFAPLENPTNERLTIEAVPTGITRVSAEEAPNEYFVALFGGCPYPPQGGEIVAIDENRHQRVVLDGLQMPIDVARGPDGTIWVLEFARSRPDEGCFSGQAYTPESGRLSRLGPDNTLDVVLTGLDFPGAVLPMPDGSLYITEIFDGRLLHVTFDEAQDAQTQARPQPDAATRSPDDVERMSVEDVDAALAAVIAARHLRANPGAELREGDTALARLGQQLFFDPILSGDQDVSCASCHHPALAMADGRVLPIGSGGAGLGAERDFVTHITLGPEASAFRTQSRVQQGWRAGDTVANPFMGQFVPRNAPTILNSALLKVQFWDGRVQGYALGSATKTQERAVNDLRLTDALAVQALFPVTSLHEMAGATFGTAAPQRIRRAIVERLHAEPAYVRAFESTFGTADFNIVHVAEALAAFERRLIFTDAPWDAYLRGDHEALSEQQKRGALLFYGAVNPAVNCAACHSGDLFTDEAFHNLLVPQLGPGKGQGVNGREDWGRSVISYDRRDQYAFRTPSLRNVALTAPYFHTGAYATLEDVIRHHADVWTSAATYDPSAHLPADFFSSLQPFDATRQGHSVAPELRDGLPLTEAEIADLVAFMRALTDPAAEDLTHLIPAAVPSGLPLDPLPQSVPTPTPAPPPPPPAALIAAANKASITPADTSWSFVDVTAESGLDFTHGAFVNGLYDDPAAMMGAGLCWIDVDRDGWLDLYLVNSHAEDERDHWGEALPRNALYRNVEGRFVDVSAGSGADLAMRGQGCTAADFDQDGWLDLYVTADGPNALLWNQGDGTFIEGANAAGVAAPEWNSAISVGDLNGDGWPDFYVGAYIDLDFKVPQPIGAFPQDYYGLPDRLYLNQGPSETGRVSFREISREAGLFRDERALGSLLSDLDGDGDLDLYLANDGQANRLYENVAHPADPLGLGFRFLDTHETADVGDTGSGMGVAGGDWDGDGQFDLFVTNWEAELNALYRNQSAERGHLHFLYSTYRIGLMGLGNNMTGWGTALADFDHDTDLDLLTVNGRVPVTNLDSDPELVRLYGNRSSDGLPGQFREWTALVGLRDVGPLLSRGSAIADYDNDGDLDVAINNIAGRAVLLETRGVHGNWLRVDVAHFAPGTVATLTLAEGQVLRRELHAGSSYLASEDPRLHFGLGDATHAERLTVRLPQGETFTFEAVSVNQALRVDPSS